MITQNIFLKKGFNRVRSERSASYMTYSGTLNKSMMLLLILIISSGISWTIFQSDTELAIIYLMIGSISGGLLGLISSFFPKISPFTAPIYTALEGLVLGTISAYFETVVPGIAISAVLATLAVCTSVLIVFKTNPNIANKLRNFIVTATFAIAILYLLNTVLGFAGFSLPYVHDMGPIGMGIDLFIIAIAAGNLLLDFQIIYNGVNNRAPKYMEWYASLGIMITLVFMYLKILDLLYKIMGKTSKD